MTVFNNCIIIIVIIIVAVIINFILIQEIGFTESLLNWNTSTGPNFMQLFILYLITETLETVNVDLELDYLHFSKVKQNFGHIYFHNILGLFNVLLNVHK